MMIRPARRRSMPLQRGAGQAERRGQVDVQHRLPVLVLHAQRQHVAGDAGVVDQDVRAGRRPPRRRRSARPAPPGRADRPGRHARARPVRRPAPPAPRAACRTAPPWRPGRAARGRSPPPMPPEAPVTRAVLPSSRNMASLPLQGLQELLRSRPACRSEPAAASGAMRRTRPASTLPAPSSTKLSTPEPDHRLHAFAPAHRGGDLLAPAGATISAGSVALAGRDIGHHRHQRGAGGDGRPAPRPWRRPPAPSGRNGTGRKPAAASPARRPWPWPSRWRARPPPCGRRSPPGRRRCRWRARPLRGPRGRRRPRRRSPRPGPCRRRAAPPWRPRRPAPPSASPGRAACSRRRRLRRR